jgi:hypothetical protein
MASESCAFVPVLRDSGGQFDVWQLNRGHDLAVTGRVEQVNAPLSALSTSSTL